MALRRKSSSMWRKISRLWFRRLLKVYFVISTTVFLSYLFLNVQIANDVLRLIKDKDRSITINYKSHVYIYDTMDKLTNKDKADAGLFNVISNYELAVVENNKTKEIDVPIIENNIGTQGQTIEDYENKADTIEADVLDYLDSLKNVVNDNFKSTEDGFDQTSYDVNDESTAEKKSNPNKNSTNVAKKSKSSIHWKRLVKEQYNLYDHNVVSTLDNIQTAYLTAIALNSTSNGALLDTVIINGWQRKKFENVKLFCCFLSEKQSAAVPVNRSHVWNTPQIRVVEAKQFICDNPWKKDPSVVPRRVGLDKSSKCVDVQYVDVEHALQPEVKDAIGFCGKIIYGNYPAERVIEWMQMNKVMGVHHVVLFTYNITKQTMSVLNHYQQQGYLTLKEFDFPMKSIFPRYIGQKYLLAWVDEQVTVFDCIQRFKGYTYVGILDMDEFLVPKNSSYENYHSVLKKLMSQHPNAAGFTFQTELFFLNWGETHSSSNLFIGKYRNRTKPFWDRMKSIVLNDRVNPHSVWTHGFNGISPYKRSYVFAHTAAVFHYRNCRPRWIVHGECFPSGKRFTDHTMQRFIPQVEKTVLELSKKLVLK